MGMVTFIVRILLWYCEDSHLDLIKKNTFYPERLALEQDDLMCLWVVLFGKRMSTFFIVCEIIMLGGVICWIVYMCVKWAANEVDRILRPCFPIFYILIVNSILLGGTTSGLLHMVLVGPVLRLLFHLLFFSVAKEVSDLGLTYILPITLTTIIGPMMTTKASFFFPWRFNLQMLEGLRAHFFEFNTLC